MSAAAPGTLVIDSVEDAASVAGSSTGAIVYALFSFVLFFFGWRSGDVTFILVTGFFAAFGIAAIVMMIRQNVSLSKFGSVKLTLEAPLPALGGHVHAMLRLPEAASQATRIEGRLVLQRVYKKGMQEDVREDWAQVWHFPARRGASSALLFDVPGELPAVVIPGQGDLLRTTWQLQVSMEVPGVDFSRSYEIPMQAAQAGAAAAPQVERALPQQAAFIAAQPDADAAAPGPDFQAIATTIVFNLLPIYGVVALGWKTGDIVWVYWCENIVIGVMHAIRLLVPQTVPTIMPAYTKAGLQLSADQVLLAKALLAGFFVMHYGAFCFGHAEFIGSLFGGRPSFGNVYFVLTVLMLLAAHMLALMRDISRGPRQVDLRYMMIRPYPRIFVVHVFLFVGGLALIHSQVAALVAFIAVKIGVDLYMQRRMQHMFDKRAA